MIFSFNEEVILKKLNKLIVEFIKKCVRLIFIFVGLFCKLVLIILVGVVILLVKLIILCLIGIGVIVI